MAEGKGVEGLMSSSLDGTPEKTSLDAQLSLMNLLPKAIPM